MTAERPFFDLYDIDYLANGSQRQQRAFTALSESSIFSRLNEEGGAALVGAIPLDLALADSTVELAAYAADLRWASTRDRSLFGEFDGFQSARGISPSGLFLKTLFQCGGETICILTESVPVPAQASVAIVMAAARLIGLGGAVFRGRVWAERLKQKSLEESFGLCLELADPVIDLPRLENLSDQELRLRFAKHFA